MAGKKTLEELRANNRERQRRYKERHGWVARARARESMRALRAGRREPLATPLVNNKPVMRDNAIPHYGELQRGDIEGVDVAYGQMEPRFKGGHREVAVVLDVPRGKPAQETDEERRVNEQLGLLKARQAEGRLNAGVEVELFGI